MKVSRKQFNLILTVLIVLCLSALGYGFYRQHYASPPTTPAKLTAVKLTDATCPNCFKLDSLLDVLKQQNIVFENIKEVDISSSKGQELMKKNNITKIPILIINGEISKDEKFSKLWEGFGQKKDETLISNVFPPYKNLKDGTTEGLVDLTVIYDATCQECYNTKLHTTFLETDGIYPVTKTKLDITDSKAQELIKKYNITKVPMIILSPAASYYKKFTENWKTDGIIADDGYYIFTTPEKIGTYRDLTTNEIIKQ